MKLSPLHDHWCIQKSAPIGKLVALCFAQELSWNRNKADEQTFFANIYQRRHKQPIFCLVAKNRLVYGSSEVALIKTKFQNDKLSFLWFIILSSFEYRVSVFLSRSIRSSCFARKFGAVPFYFLLMLSNGLLNSFIHHFFGKNAIRGAVRTSLELKNNQQSKSLSLSSRRQPNRRQGERDVWTAHIRYIKSLTWLRGLRDKIANFLRLHCLAIPRRDLSTKKTKPNIETWPEILGCHVRILIYWMWAIHRVIMPSCDITD